MNFFHDAKKLLLNIIILCCIGEVLARHYFNLTKGWDPKQDHERQKRFIYWQNGGICKVVVGISFPVLLGDKKPWRQLNYAYNLQAQFAVPTRPIYWWEKWNGRSLADAKIQYNKDGTYHPDESQVFLYALIEHYANRAGKNGRKCLLRAICENAAVYEHVGIYAEIFHAILTPNENADADYKYAYEAGKAGDVCTELYPECPPAEGIFDKIFFTEAVEAS